MLKRVTESAIAGARHQFGVLPYLVGEDGTLQVVLVTSRGSGRWTIPKGNPMAGKKPHKAAEKEALQEAGLVGKVGKKPVGSYALWKRMDAHFVLATVTVFPLAVSQRLVTFKEMAQRRVEAYPQAVAADLVQESGLAELIRTFRVPEAS
jgi:8-oxo-dGTP pyrophosphatase MutT (NUDIX family)